MDKDASPLDEVVDTPDNVTLDRVLSTAPSLITDADLDAVIAAYRKERALFIQADQEKKYGKAEPSTPTPSQED